MRRPRGQARPNQKEFRVYWNFTGEAVIGLMNVESKFQKQTENITFGVTRGFLPGGSWVRD